MGMRLQKYMADCAVASRRGAEKLIESGRVSVNGEIIDFMGFIVDPDKDIVEVDGNLIKPETKKYYIALNKPKNYVTTVKDDVCVGNYILVIILWVLYYRAPGYFLFEKLYNLIF